MDRFQDSAKKGFDFLKSRAKETVEAQKLNSSIRDIEERRDSCLQDLGHRVVAMFDTANFDREALRDRVEEVRRLSADLEAAQHDYDSLKNHFKTSVEEILPKGVKPEPTTPGSIPEPDYT